VTNLTPSKNQASSPVSSAINAQPGIGDRPQAQADTPKRKKKTPGNESDTKTQLINNL